MVLKEIFSMHILELLLITISTFVAVKTYRTRGSSRVTRAFSAFSTANMLFQILDFCMTLNREGFCFNGHTVGSLLYVVTLTAMACTGYHWFLYVEEAIGAGTFATRKKTFFWRIPLLVFSVMCIASVKTGWIFTFDAAGKYKIGSLFIIQYVVIFGYCLMAMVRSAINYFVKKEKRDTDRILLVIMLVDTAAVIIQLSFMVNMMNTALVLTVLLSYMTVYSFEMEQIRNGLEKERLSKQKEENERNRIIETLSEDFGCVMYVELKEDEDSDISTNYRVSGLLKRIIPRWEIETGFKKKLKLLLDYVVYEPDKERVIYDTGRDLILEKLKDEDVYYTDCRLVIDGEIKYYQMKFSAVRENGKLIGVVTGLHSVDEAYKEQQKRLLGDMPLSNNVLAKANIGMWAFELDEGRPPRMYDDETMLGLVGLDRQVSPEEAYHAWYDNIDAGAYDLVNDAVAKMMEGEHAEVQYPWHYPDGRTIMVRCGGIRNYGYTKGIRIEGTHQNVTETLHFDEEERKRAQQTENDLVMSKLRADSLAYIADNEPDLDSAINFFGKRILEISGCDQVIFRELNGHRIVLNAPGIEDIPQEICSHCPFAQFGGAGYGEEGVVLMNDCRKGCNGVMTHPDCPARSSFMQRIYSGGELEGLFTVHYLNEQHTFSKNGIEVLKTVAIYLGLLIGRIKEKQAEIARIEAESSSKAKTEFLFNMSHDIRTPMNAILGYTDIAINHIDEPERVSDSLKKIKTSGGHLLSLINDVLEMSRIEAGRMEIVNIPVNIHEVTEGIVNMSQALASTKDITFNADIKDLKNPYVYADELHTNQVIINLISNAIKYTQPGGTVDYRIEQITDPVAGVANYRVTVKDNGIGMSEEFQKHLFESFAREKTATVSRQEGAGLGLAIVKKIVDLIGGTISAQSKQGEGSAFTVELPLAVMDSAAAEAFEASRHTGSEVSKDISLAGKKVLLVEDNEMNREIATELLEENGLTVESAEDGALAVRKVMERGADRYDFILMDIQMPVMNGYEATAEIRRLPGGDTVPIIALSANAFREDVEKSLAAGMNDHVAKPINVKELFSVLAEHI